MNVLIACESSGRVRDAFRALGHNAWSCDLLPSESPHGPQLWHFCGDAVHVANTPGSCGMSHWDLMIAHPPCTYLCNSGVRWLFRNPTGVRVYDVQGNIIRITKGRAEWLPSSGVFQRSANADRIDAMVKATAFFFALWNSNIPRICVENPIPHRHAALPPYTQIIQPWQFGHGETKATCLWLKGLPKLVPTRIVKGRVGRIHMMPPGPNRWKERSKTYKGIAAAMAKQWS